MNETSTKPDEAGPTPLDRPARLIPVPEKLACITLDYEMDYGDRIGAFNILTANRPEIEALGACFDRHDVPVSAFVRTDLLTDYPESGPALRVVARDFHCHSHTHSTRAFDSEREIAQTREAFEAYFGEAPLGYRAPLGVLYEGDVDLLKQYGFQFSSSVFPSFRPGKFNNLSMPVEPFYYENGLLELPMAVLPRVRSIFSISYLKLMGWNVNRAMIGLVGLPNLLVFDTHLHDFIVNEESFRRLPLALRLAWGRNRYAGVAYFERLVETLKARGYRFITMSELYGRVSELAG